MRRALAVPFIAAGMILANPLSAQELFPRAYWPAPVGTRILSLVYINDSGDILTDPSLPVIGVDSDINTLAVAYVNTHEFYGRTGRFILDVPWATGTVEGRALDNSRLPRDVQGLGDIAMTYSVNLLGAPSMDAEGYSALRADPPSILGFSLKVVMPTSEYDRHRVVNVGANRWAFKAELGYVQPLATRWLFEAELGAWYFGDNDDFVRVTREQESTYAAELHLVRRFRPGFWGSLNLNYYHGGRSRIDGVVKDDLQRTSTVGATLVTPTSKRAAIKAALNWGSVTENDNRFSRLVLS